MSFLEILEKNAKPPYILAAGITLTGLIGIADFLTGYEIGFSLFYVLPISMVTWLTNRRLGLVTSFVGALIWLCADAATGHPYSHPLIPVWNTLVRLSLFLIIAFLLSSLRRATEREKELARIDDLTGAVNSRFFHELAQMEIDRFQRYARPFTLAYVDLDNFKGVNDRFGHSSGDQVLRVFVSSARKHLRKSDVVARLGGDEFALLLPETGQESARLALSKFQRGVLEEMRRGNWPITFSIGALTCIAAPSTTEELVRMADDLMYSVKRDGKNGIRYSTCQG
jgi:diguanylate cyclase (GGDEF)-like protein